MPFDREGEEDLPLSLDILEIEQGQRFRTSRPLRAGGMQGSRLSRRA